MQYAANKELSVSYTDNATHYCDRYTIVADVKLRIMANQVNLFYIEIFKYRYGIWIQIQGQKEVKKRR
jgi:hypothetical protein